MSSVQNREAMSPVQISEEQRQEIVRQALSDSARNAGLARWEGISQEERKRQMSRVAKRRWNALRKRKRQAA